MFLKLLHYHYYKKNKKQPPRCRKSGGHIPGKHWNIKFEKVILKSFMQPLLLSCSIWLRKESLCVCPPVTHFTWFILTRSLNAAKKKKRLQWSGKRETTVFLSSQRCMQLCCSMAYSHSFGGKGRYIWVYPLCTQILLWLPSTLDGSLILKVYVKK